MSVLPIVAREMRVASRKGATYWNRTIVALGAVIVATFALFILTHSSPKDTGFLLFIWMSVVAYVHCLTSGLIFTSDSLSEEKREGTLGLLFLTDLKSYDIVLGKLVASSFRGVFGLLAIFPVLGICLLLGGVAPAEFGRVMLVCLNNLFLSLSLGILASSICQDDRKAMTLAFVVVVLLTAGCPALGTYVGEKMHWRPFPLVLFAPSPGFSSFLAFSKVYNGERFVLAVITQHLMAWAALLLACRIVPRSWQDKIVSSAAAKRQRTLKQWIYGAPAIRAAFRRYLLNINPYYWLTARDRFKHTQPWLWLAGAGLIWFIGLVKWPSDWREPGAYMFTAFMLHGFFKVWVAFEASRRLGADRQSGALELLLCTPISVRDILKGQWLGLMRQFGLPVLVVCMVDVIFFAAGFRQSRPDEKLWFFLWLAGGSIFLLDLVTLAWLSMWFGFTHRRTGQGGVNALVWVGVVPWLGLAGFLAFIAIMEELRILRMSKVDDYLLLIWWLISAAVDAFFGLSAYRRLHNDLRSMATHRYEGRGAIWGRALGLIYGRWRAGRNAPATPAVPPVITR